MNEYKKAKHKKVLPICPVYCVTYVTGCTSRGQLTHSKLWGTRCKRKGNIVLGGILDWIPDRGRE